MLSQLQNMLENMQMAGGGQMTRRAKVGDRGAGEAGLDDRAAARPDGQDVPRAAAGERRFAGAEANHRRSKSEQEKLSDELSADDEEGGSWRRWRQALRRAQDAMDEAADELGQRRTGQAGENQQKAIDELRKGGEAVAKQLLQQMQAQGAIGAGPRASARARTRIRSGGRNRRLGRRSAAR